MSTPLQSGTHDWIRYKCGAYQRAWSNRFGIEPSVHNMVLAVSVAWHETRCGDAWPGEFNWGATTLRSLNAAELAAVKAAGIVPTIGPGHPERAKAAMVAIAAAGLPMPQGAIHCDSKPVGGKSVPYFTWFAAFPDDVGGADYFIRLLCVRKDGTFKLAKTVLEDERGNEDGLARAMYSAGYYTGFHDPKLVYGGVPGPEMNITAYANSIRRFTPRVRIALSDPLPSPLPEPEEPTLKVNPIPLSPDWDAMRAERDARVKES